MRAKNAVPITTHCQDRRHLTWRVKHSGRTLAFVVAMVRIRDEFRTVMGARKMRAHPNRRVRPYRSSSGRLVGIVGIRYPDNTWMVMPQPAVLRGLGDTLYWCLYSRRSAT